MTFPFRFLPFFLLLSPVRPSPVPLFPGPSAISDLSALGSPYQAGICFRFPGPPASAIRPASPIRSASPIPAGSAVDVRYFVLRQVRFHDRPQTARASRQRARWTGPAPDSMIVPGKRSE